MIISAALAAAAPATPAQAPDPHAQHQSMNSQSGHHGHKGAMKDCCCEDMAKHDGSRSDPKPSQGRTGS
jgi:hypothetical protein